MIESYRVSVVYQYPDVCIQLKSRPVKCDEIILLASNSASAIMGGELVGLYTRYEQIDNESQVFLHHNLHRSPPMV